MTEEIFERLVERLSYFLRMQIDAFDMNSQVRANSWGNMARGFERAVFDAFGQEELDRVVNAAEIRARE